MKFKRTDNGSDQEISIEILIKWNQKNQYTYIDLEQLWKLSYEVRVELVRFAAQEFLASAKRAEKKPSKELVEEAIGFFNKTCSMNAAGSLCLLNEPYLVYQHLLPHATKINRLAHLYGLSL